MNYTWWKKSLALVLALAFVLAGTAAVAAEEDPLVIGQGGDAPGLHTLMEVDIPAYERINLINEPLFFIDYDLTLEPNLATDWEISDDALQIDVELREGVEWHHGGEMTAEDVAYTFEWILDEDNPAENRDLYEAIEEIEIVDDYNIVFHLDEPYTFLVNNMARVGIIPEEYHEEVGYEEFRQNPSGTGPYIHEEWADDDYHRLSANENYWGGEPNFAELEFRPIPEDSSRLLAFEGGEIDMFEGGVVPDEVERLEADEDIEVHRVGGAGYDYIGFNNNVVTDQNLRLAISYALNREAIVEHVMGGVGMPGESNLTPDMAHYNEELDFVHYDPDIAEEYLDEVEEKPDQLRIFTNENPVRMQIAEILEYELGEIGIDAQVEVEEWGAFLDRVYDTDDYEMFILGWAGQVDPDRASYRQFHSEGSSNHVNYENERMDELLEEGRAIDPDSEESMEIYGEVQEILNEEQPKMFVSYSEEIALVHDEYEGFELHPYPANNWLQLVDDVELAE